ncbi:cell wall-binding repeat-containing protein [Bifidobacterium longum]|nr:cell wall-binding repeat-containing protein [Bifidobacterium longum]
MTATGPVSSASVNVAGQNRSARGNDSYNGNASITVDVDFSTLTAVEAHSMTIKAYGLNYDVSNDDVSKTIQFQAGRDAYATVTFDSNGGSTVASQNIHIGTMATQPMNPTRSGYTFQGWYTAKNGGTKYDFSQTVNGDMTLYAHWAKEPNALQRLAGDTRYDTMGAVVNAANWKTGGTVIVASGGNYPDALAASGLAGTMNAPIILTDGNILSPQAQSQLNQLAPSRIVIAGGASAISNTVMNSLKNICPNVQRVAGETRVDTSLNLYREGSGWGSTAVLATAGNFADALSISSYAYHMKAPVFLVNTNDLTARQRSALASGRFSKVIVVGGTNAVSDHVAANAQSITGAQLIRLSGATRYETSEQIARWTMNNGLSMNGAVYATGANFPDALAAGPLAGKSGSVTLLVENANSPAVSFSAEYKGKVDKAYVVGGTNVVDHITANAIADSLGLRHAQ